MKIPSQFWTQSVESILEMLHRGLFLRLYWRFIGVQNLLQKRSIVMRFFIIRCLIYIGVFLLMPVVSCAQPSQSLPDVAWSTGTSALHDFGEYLVSPFHWDSQQWSTAGTILGVTGLLILVDRPIYDAVNPESFNSFNNFADPLLQLGGWYNMIKLLSAGCVTGLVLNDTKLHRASYLALTAFGAQAAVVQTLKNLTGRTYHGSPYDFRGSDFSHLPSNYVLPSGHASIVWSAMTVFAEVYKDDPVIPFLCYGTATLSSAVLITGKWHWASDIFLGAMIGYYTGKAAIYLDDLRTVRTDSAIYPVITDAGVGVGYINRF